MNAIKVYCPNCGKELGVLSWDMIRFHPSERDENGKIKWFCDEECIEQYKEQFQVDIYKGHKIYFIERGEQKGYMPYWGCLYYFTNIKDCMDRIDAPVTYVHPMFLQRR